MLWRNGGTLSRQHQYPRLTRTRTLTPGHCCPSRRSTQQDQDEHGSNDPEGEAEEHNCDALLAGFHEKVLEVEQRLLGRVHVDERGRDTGLAATARTADLVHVVLDFLGHGEDDDVLDVVEVETLGCDAGRDHHILRA